MILELDTSWLNKLNISINQLVFINLVLNENQKNNQDIHSLLSRVGENEIQDLINRNIIIFEEKDNNKIYKVSENTVEDLKVKADMFDELYDTFPVYVVRPDGTKGFLRANVNKCRHEYKKIIGKSIALHNHIMECLNYELQNKIMTGKLGYMKTMWKWITQHEWECYEEQMQDDINTTNESLYGTTVI